MTTLATYIASTASWMRSYTRREEGATMVEYALIVSVIALVVVVGAGLLGISIRDMFSGIASGLGGGGGEGE